MRRAVRLFLFVVLLSCLLFPAGTARAATKVQIVEYKCRVCDKLFYSFKGDKVGENELAKQAEQLAKLSQLAERGKRLEECRGGYKSHVLDKTREGEATMEFISKNLQRFFVVKDGGSPERVFDGVGVFHLQKALLLPEPGKPEHQGMGRAAELPLQLERAPHIPVQGRLLRPCFHAQEGGQLQARGAWRRRERPVLVQVGR